MCICCVQQENLSTEELEQFAKELKHKRITLGFTQADVGLALGNLYGKLIFILLQSFSVTHDATFKPQKLSFLIQSPQPASYSLKLLRWSMWTYFFRIHHLF